MFNGMVKERRNFITDFFILVTVGRRQANPEHDSFRLPPSEALTRLTHRLLCAALHTLDNPSYVPRLSRCIQGTWHLGPLRP